MWVKNLSHRFALSAIVPIIAYPRRNINPQTANQDHWWKLCDRRRATNSSTSMQCRRKAVGSGWCPVSFSYKRSSIELCDPTAACPGYPGSKVPGFINWFWMVYTLDMPVQAQRLNPNSVFFKTWLVVPLLFPQVWWMLPTFGATKSTSFGKPPMTRDLWQAGVPDFTESIVKASPCLWGPWLKWLKWFLLEPHINHIILLCLSMSIPFLWSLFCYVLLLI